MIITSHCDLVIWVATENSYTLTSYFANSFLFETVSHHRARTDLERSHVSPPQPVLLTLNSEIVSGFHDVPLSYCIHYQVIHQSALIRTGPQSMLTNWVVWTCEQWMFQFYLCLQMRHITDRASALVLPLSLHSLSELSYCPQAVFMICSLSSIFPFLLITMFNKRIDARASE